jgi:hypothetical protein
LAGSSAFVRNVGSGETSVEPEMSKTRPPRAAATPHDASDSMLESDHDLDQDPSPGDHSKAADIRLIHDGSEVQVGAIIQLGLWIEDAHDVASVPFHVLFDPGVLSFSRASEGPFLAGDGTGTAFMFAPQSKGGRIVVGHSRLTRDKGMTGSGLLCTLEFVAVGSGDSKLGFERAMVIKVDGRPQESSFRAGALVVR